MRGSASTRRPSASTSGGVPRERMAPGHRNWFLDSDRAPLPRRPRIDTAIERWTFSARRHVPPPLLAHMRAGASGCVREPSPRFRRPVPRRRPTPALPVVANVASWDHGRQGRDPDVPRPLRRPELARWPTISSGSTTCPRSASRSRAGPDRRLRTHATQGGLRRPPRVVRLRSAATSRSLHGQHTHEHALGGALCRPAGLAAYASSGAQDRFGLLVRPHPRDGDRVARGSGRGGGRRRRPDGARLRGSRPARAAAPALRLRRLERRDGVARRDRQRSPPPSAC